MGRSFSTVAITVAERFRDEFSSLSGKVLRADFNGLYRQRGGGWSLSRRVMDTRALAHMLQ